MQVYSESDIGLVRSSNQDDCRTGIFPDGTAWAVVCDGMGGANGGCTASRVAVETIAAALQNGYEALTDEDKLHELMASAVQEANGKVYALSQEDFSLRGMGTTVVAAVVRDGRVYTVHAGDSRAYLISDGTVKQLTKDHSIVQELVDMGQITEEQARCHPQKNIITRALGTRRNLKTDDNRAEFPEGSVLVICTDGLSNYVTEDSLLAFVKTSKGSELTAKLIHAAKQLGGSDNITVAVIEG